MEASSEKSTNPNEGKPTGEPTSNEESENRKVGITVGTAQGAICQGYNAETTLTLAFSIDSIAEMPTSEKILVANHLKWYLYVRQYASDGENFLAIYAKSDEMKKYPMTVDLKYTLVANDAKNSIVRDLKRVHGEPDYHVVGVTMISWLEFLKDREKFESDGKVTVTAKFSISLPSCCNFSVENSFADVKIKVGDFTFPFNKMHLAAQSPFFDALFFGPLKEANQTEVTLTDVDVAAFVNLINLLFIRPFELKIKSVAPVLLLADRFGMSMIVEHCEKMLLDCALPAGPCLAERLALSAKYSLKKLQKRCVELCTSVRIAMEVKTSPHYKDIPDAVRLLVLDHAMEAAYKAMEAARQDEERLAADARRRGMTYIGPAPSAGVRYLVAE